MLSFTLLFLALLTLPTGANLGDTVEQCVARYGKPIRFTEANGNAPFGTVVYAAGGYTLVLFVIRNREVGARVSKTDKSAFTDAEMQGIMDADTAGGKWVPGASSDPSCLQWSRGDSATVLYDKEKHMLIFTSPEMAKALNSPAASAAPVPTPAAK